MKSPYLILICQQSKLLETRQSSITIVGATGVGCLKWNSGSGEKERVFISTDQNVRMFINSLAAFYSEEVVKAYYIIEVNSSLRS
jgi:hypothetical protein